MHYTSGPGFDSQWRPNILNSVLFKKACERERIHLMNNNDNNNNNSNTVI